MIRNKVKLILHHCTLSLIGKQIIDYNVIVVLSVEYRYYLKVCSNKKC